MCISVRFKGNMRGEGGGKKIYVNSKVTGKPDSNLISVSVLHKSSLLHALCDYVLLCSRIWPHIS